MIQFVITATFTGRCRYKTYKYKSLTRARKAARKALGTDTPSLTPGGYAVGAEGQSLEFVENCSFEEFFPDSTKYEIKVHDADGLEVMPSIIHWGTLLGAKRHAQRVAGGYLLSIYKDGHRVAHRGCTGMW